MLRRSARLSFAISIHALHEESDVTWNTVARNLVISIHALHEESDPFAPTDPG